MKWQFLIAGILCALQSTGQVKTVDTAHFYYDTAKVFAWYVNNLQFGTSTTSYVYKVTKSKFDFAQPTPDELRKDSFVVKKNKVPLETTYYIPMNVLDSVATKKAKRNIYNTIYSAIPADLILFDAHKNFDYLIPAGKANGNKK